MDGVAQGRGFTPHRAADRGGEGFAGLGGCTPHDLAAGEELMDGSPPGTRRLPSNSPVRRRIVTWEGVLSIRDLKDLVLARFPEDHPLRQVILAEKDLLTPTEFLAKMEVWSVLLNR